MTQSSVGFAGTVDDAQWATLAPLLGNGPIVDAAASLLVTAVAGNRRVLVAAGKAFSSGILTTLSAAESPADIVAPTAGQWHLVVLRRVWATKVTSLVTIPHTTTADATQATPPTTYPAAMLASPGVQEDQPLAWAWVSVSSTAVAVWDLRILPNTSRLGTITTLADALAMYTAAAGWTLNSATIAYSSTVAQVRFSVTRTGGTIAGTTDGNIGNTLVLTTKAAFGTLKPAVQAPLPVLSTGVAAGFFMETFGDVLISTSVPGQSIINGDSFVIGGSFVRSI